MILQNHGEIEDITLFILPMVMKSDTTYENIPKPILKTCISIFDRPELDDKIILVSSHKMELLERRKDIYYKHLYDEDRDKYYHIFETAIENEEDLYKILIGKYYNISTKYKQRILTFWKQSKDSMLFNVLCKNWHYHRIGVSNLIYGYK